MSEKSEVVNNYMLKDEKLNELKKILLKFIIFKI